MSEICNATAVDKPLLLSEAHRLIESGEFITIVTSFRFRFVYYCRTHHPHKPAIERGIRSNQVNASWFRRKACGVATYIEWYRSGLHLITQQCEMDLLAEL